MSREGLERFRAQPANLRASFMMLGSAVLFVLMSTLVKILGETLSAVQIAFFRSLTGLIFILPFLLRQGRAGFITGQPVLQVIRGLCGAGAMMAGFYAFANLPLADATAITFARALFLVVLAVIILREVVGARRLLATLAGFAGVLIMLRPTGAVELASLAALANTFLVALAVVFVKILSRTDGPLTLLFYSGVIGTFAIAVPAALVWQTPTWTEFALLIVMGLFGVMGHNLFIRAYAIGEATAIAPLDYTRIVFATLIGLFLFGTFPDEWTILGGLIIAASSLYITIREAQIAKAKSAEPRPPGSP